MQPAQIDKKMFREALGSFVTGVTIVTTCDAEGRPIGLTANSFNSVSLDPPLVLWSLSLASGSFPAFRAAEYWAVHVLAAGQKELSARFATRAADKFAGLTPSRGPGGIPLLEGCAARFVCKATFEYEGGDHAIFVGEVVDLTLQGAPPLVFHSGRYSRIIPPGERGRPSDSAAEGEFARYFTAHLLGLAHHVAFSEVRREYRKRGLRGSDYTVISSLGLGEGVGRSDLIARAARGGVELPQQAIDRMIQRGEIAERGDRLHLTDSGRRLLTELIAVAQATQLQLDDCLAPEEMALLHELLQRLAGRPPAST
jgi:3-hydroxy-9,10-secoandrosta-1,3,5(10)-triene-9,17-dione monooxygenase reductase component